MALRGDTNSLGRVTMVNDILVKKYERYFWDPKLEDKPLRPPISSVACINIRHALAILGFAVSFGNHEKKSYDEELLGVVRTFQEKQGHSAIDGYVGLRTRRLLTEALLRQSGPKVFKRFVDLVGKRPKTVFLSYAHADRDRVDIPHTVRD
jgi:hypothetical protein